MARIAYLGPEGTFAEQAARVFARRHHDEPRESGEPDEHAFVPLRTVPLALDAVRRGEAEHACVPVENSVEGAVTATMDALAADEPLVAVAEVVLPIAFAVLTRPGVTAADVRTVASHPHALAQVQAWLLGNLAGADTVAATSTAAAAAAVAAGEYDAAGAAPVATTHYPLAELATGVADVPDAMTRFLVLRRPGAAAGMPAPTGADRTSIAVVAAAERTGVLAELLTELALRGINLSRIESRPMKGRLGEYRFYLDFDGHVAEQRVGDALAALHRRSHHVRFLGSYPKADATASAVPPGSTDADYAAATEWLTAVRQGRY